MTPDRETDEGTRRAASLLSRFVAACEADPRVVAAFVYGSHAAGTADAVFTGEAPARADQIETLRRILIWFWHDVSHFVAAMGRGQLGWAAGQLDVLRLMCVNLARLAEDFSGRADGHDKVDLALPAARQAPLFATWCPLDREAMLRAALALVAFHGELGPALASAHGVPYPERLARMMCGRLQALSPPTIGPTEERMRRTSF